MTWHNSSRSFLCVCFIMSFSIFCWSSSLRGLFLFYFISRDTFRMLVPDYDHPFVKKME